MDSFARVVDVTIAMTVILLLLPVLVLIALAIVLADPGPVFFAHQRIGYRGKVFPCFKFRSMVVDSEQRLAAYLSANPIARTEWIRDHKLRDDPRITPLGRFLRATSLDELPQLFNVVRGEMSLVGPRPIVAGEIARYSRFFQDYKSVRPGITGLWQVSGRSETSYRRRVALDVTYIRTKSLRLDIAILAMTLPAVLLRKGSC